ncbi:MAG: hypothetical protein HY331_18120 [Chloroflexi bacterium]|nr:hypothetical protein [Chloroflexota bacterium]
MVSVARRAPRILFFGMRCGFSVPPLAALLDAGLSVCAVVLPSADGLASAEPIWRLPGNGGPAGGRFLLAPRRMRTIVDLARERQVPVLEVTRLGDPRTVATLAAMQPDFICVACFPRRLSAAILALPRHGCLNVHPSLLPANRGPVPLFWTFRLDERRAGVTVHRMESALDAGDIVLQEPLAVPEGIGGHDLEQECAAMGGRLLVAAVESITAGTAEWTRQTPEQASYHGWPTPDDFVVAPSWPARHAFNFIRGAAHWGTPTVIYAGRRLPVSTTLGYVPDGAPDGPAVADGRLWIPCNPGLVEVVLAGEE